MMKNFKPCVIWFTGLSGSGKSTLAEAVYEQLLARGIKAAWLDGDKIREVFPQTGFTKEERHNHVCRIGYTASILESHGITVVCSFISPYTVSRNFVRNVCHDYKEVYVNTPLSVCIDRDPKGLYKKVEEGKILNFTGIDDPYEEPQNPWVELQYTYDSIIEDYVWALLTKLELV